MELPKIDEKITDQIQFKNDVNTNRLLFSMFLANFSSNGGTRALDESSGFKSHMSFICKGLRHPLYINGSKKQNVVRFRKLDFGSGLGF